MPNTQHELLPIVIQQDNTFIDARLLHRKLKSKQEFSNWIKARINDFGFEKDKDFLINLSKSTGGRKPMDYLLTLDMAKELAMLERNDVGREIRRYFIAKEKELRGVSQLPKEPELFRGLKPKPVNGREMYPYSEILIRAGYKPNSNGNRRHRYWMHFIKEGKTLWVSKDFALHLYHQKKVVVNRNTMLSMQPVLPLNFEPSKTLN